MFSKRDIIDRIKHAQLGVLPRHERFETCKLFGWQINNWLEGDPDFFAVDGAFQVVCDRRPIVRVSGEALAIDLNRIGTGALGAAHGDFGLREQITRRVGVR